MFGREFLAVARCSCNGVRASPFHRSSYVSGTLVGVVVVAVVAVAVQLFSWESLAVVWRNCSGVREWPLRLSNFGVDIFALDYDAIHTAMHALPIGTEGDCSLCVRPDPGIEAAALGASESALLGTAPAEALHTFTLDSGASRCFFRDSTTLTPLSAPVPVRLANPSGGPILARSSTVLPCPAVPSGSRAGLHLPSFPTNMVSTAALQDAMVTTTTPGGQRVSICTCTRTGCHLSMFTHQPGSSLYTLATEPPQVAASAQVSASGQVAPPCSCRLLSHHTLLWHHRVGHPSLPRLRGMHSRLLVSGLPRSLPPLPPSRAPPCLPCVEGRQRAAPHSSFLATTALLQTLHMDLWGPARVSGQGRERYFLLVLNDYTRYTTVLPLRSKGQVVDVMIPWIRAFRLQLRERFRTDLPVLCLHSNRGVMEVTRTSMIHAAAPHFLWPFAVRYAAHQLNLWPRVSLPETSPTLRWTEKVGDASVFEVWGSCAFVRDTSTDKLSAHAIPYVFLGFSPDAPGWQFNHPTLRRVFLSQVDPLPRTAPVEVAVGSSAASGAASGGTEPGGAEPGGEESEGAGSGGDEPWGAEPGGVEPARVEPRGTTSGGTESRGTASSGGPVGAPPRLSPRPLPLSPQQLREWFAQRTRLRHGATGAGDSAAGDTGAGGAGVTFGAGGTGGAAAAGPGGARTGGTGAAGAGGVGGARAGDPTEPGAAGAGGAGAVDPGAGGKSAGGAGAREAGAVDPGARGVGGTLQPRPYIVPLLQQVLGVPSSPGLTPPLLCPPPDQSQQLLQPASAMPAPSPYTEQVGGLTERRVPASCPASPVRIGRHVPRSSPPPVLGTHAMTLRPSYVPLRVPLPPPPESSLPASTVACALVAQLVYFAAACRLDYATTLVAESESASLPSVRGECALGTDVLEERQEDFESLSAAVPRFASMLLAPEGDPDAPDTTTPRSYVEAIMGP
ncbi:unnamed protein product [Closterium sp. NIES-54]